jgi:RNase P/RNase MRP subunit p29
MVAGMKGSVISEGGGWVVAEMRGYLQCTKHKNQTRIPLHAQKIRIQINDNDDIPSCTTGAVSCLDTRYRKE